ncbi:hypothetical protein JCM6882_006903 [Rhodosporidiobolus microsporus]
MEATLITRTHGAQTTEDRTLEIVLAGQGKQPREAVAQVPSEEWSSSLSGSHTFAAASQPRSLNRHLQTHALPASLLPSSSSSSSASPSGGTEFATFVQGRQAWQENLELREGVEDGLRRFAEGADITEGYLLTTPFSDGFSGLTPSFLELARDEFGGGTGKASVWVTGMLEDGGSEEGRSERSSAHHLLSPLLSLSHLLSSSLCSTFLPIQPSYSFSPADPREGGWTRYLRKDLDEKERKEAAEAVRDVGLRGAGEEFREPGALPDLIFLLNWRGNTPVAHLSSMAPVPSAEDLGLAGLKTEAEKVRRLKEGWKDWSVLRAPALDAEGVKPRPPPATPYAQYSIVRGFNLHESQALGPLLEKAVEPLREPFSRWVSLEPPYPITPSFPPIFAGLLPTGRPINLARPSFPLSSLTESTTNPSAASGALFGLPNPLYPPTSSYTIPPTSIPVLSTLSTTPDSRYWFRAVLRGVRELRRVRSPVLREYEEGEYGVGREGVEEAVEGWEGLVDAYGGGGLDEEGEDEEGALGGVGGEGKDVDEDWSATEPKEEEFDFDLE